MPTSFHWTITSFCNSCWVRFPFQWYGQAMWPPIFVYITAQISRAFHLSFFLLRYGTPLYSFSFTFIYFCFLHMKMGCDCSFVGRLLRRKITNLHVVQFHDSSINESIIHIIYHNRLSSITTACHDKENV